MNNNHINRNNTTTKKIRFRVRHCLAPGCNIKWRSYSMNGNKFDCGNSTRGLRERNETFVEYEADPMFCVFAWMPFSTAGTATSRNKVPFSPHEVLPIPTTLLFQQQQQQKQQQNNHNEIIEFVFDEKNQCHPSHMAIFVSNQTKWALKIMVGQQSFQVEPSVLVAPSPSSSNGVTNASKKQQQQFSVIELAFKAVPVLGVVVLCTETDQMATSLISNGDTVIVTSPSTSGGGGGGGTMDHNLDHSLHISTKPFSCPIPVYDIPIRCINRSGETATIVISMNTNKNTNTNTNMSIVNTNTNTNITSTPVSSNKKCINTNTSNNDNYDDVCEHTLTTGIQGNEYQRIIWLSSVPTKIIWSTSSVSNYNVLPFLIDPERGFYSGMTFTIRNPRAIYAAQALILSTTTGLSLSPSSPSSYLSSATPPPLPPPSRETTSISMTFNNLQQDKNGNNKHHYDQHFNDDSSCIDYNTILLSLQNMFQNNNNDNGNETNMLINNSKKKIQQACQFVEMLEGIGELERCGPLFAEHYIEYDQLSMLTENDWHRIGIKVGSKLRIKEQLYHQSMWTKNNNNKYRSTSTGSNSARHSAAGSPMMNHPHRIQHRYDNHNNNNHYYNNHKSYHDYDYNDNDDHDYDENDNDHDHLLYKYDVFLSHRHVGGEDLAQAIKLQLQVMFPEKLRIFLDVDDLKDLKQLKQHVRESKHFLLLLTPGVLDRPYIQMEIETALEIQKQQHQQQQQQKQQQQEQEELEKQKQQQQQQQQSDTTTSAAKTDNSNIDRRQRRESRNRTSTARIQSQSQRRIVLVHDIKNCSFPDEKQLPIHLRPILDRLCIPYYRDQTFRENAMYEIAKAIMGLDDRMTSPLSISSLHHYHTTTTTTTGDKGEEGDFDDDTDSDL